jgi:hypothetical protein
MPELKNRFEFEPDSNARQRWLGTRKTSFPCGDQILPGFYRTDDNQRDTKWVILAACIECVAVVMTLIGGFSKGGLYLLFAILAIVFFIIFDFVGANFFHRNKGRNCLLSNRIRITKDAAVKEALRNEMKEGKMWEVLGMAFIIFSAVLKITSVLLLGRLNIVFYGILTIFYLLVIYIHSFHTGYWLAERSTDKFFLKNHEEWAKDTKMAEEGKLERGDIRHKARVLESQIESAIMLMANHSVEITVGGIKINFERENQQGAKCIYFYKLTTTGLLLDYDFTLLTNRLDQNQAGIIGLECLKHQINRIH